MSQQLDRQWAVEHEMLHDLVDDRYLPPCYFTKMFCEVSQLRIRQCAEAEASWADVSRAGFRPGMLADHGVHKAPSRRYAGS